MQNDDLAQKILDMAKNFPYSNDAEEAIYKRGWYDGYQEALKKAPSLWPPAPSPLPPTTVVPTTPFPNKYAAGACPVCGLQGSHNYICANWNCPSKFWVASNIGAVGASGGGKSENEGVVYMSYPESLEQGQMNYINKLKNKED